MKKFVGFYYRCRFNVCLWASFYIGVYERSPPGLLINLEAVFYSKTCRVIF